MPPKKSRVRLRQSKVSFPLPYHAIVANHVVPLGIFGLVLSSRFSIDIDRVILISNKAWRSSTLFVLIIMVSEEYISLPIINNCNL